MRRTMKAYMITIEVNGRSIPAEKGEMLLDVAAAGGHKRADAVPHRRSDRQRRLPHVRGRGGRPARTGAKLRISGRRRHEGSHPFAARRAMPGKQSSNCLLANHPDDCLYCVRNGNCQLQQLAEELGVRQRRFAGEHSRHYLDTSSPSIVRDPAKCILCGKCVRVCEEIQGVAAIDFIGRGSQAKIGTAFDEGLNVSSCINCGQCITVCPTGALCEQSQIKEVLDALNDPQQGRRRATRAGGFGHAGRGIRLAAGHGRHRRDDHRATAAGFQPRLRHQLHGRPDDHGRRLGIGPSHPQRRQTADADQLLARLDQVRRDVLSRFHRQSFDLQKPATDDGRDHQELLCRAGRNRSDRASTA